MCVIIKWPSECSEGEIKDFFLFVKKSGEVSLYGLKDRIRRARCLAFYYEEDELIGIVGLKRPNENYKNRIFKSAGVSGEAESSGPKSRKRITRHACMHANQGNDKQATLCRIVEKIQRPNSRMGRH